MEADRPTPTLLGNRPPMPMLVCRDGKVIEVEGVGEAIDRVRRMELRE